MLTRTAAQVARRTLLPLSSRLYSSETPLYSRVDPVKGKVADDQVDMPDTLGHAVGIERFELLARAAGNEDPFELNIKKRAKGTKGEPTIIPSMYHYRLVGCICEEDAVSINWMYLYKGEPRRCNCGYWFKLVDLEVPDYGQ
ncbi:hypothetical protein LSAT2_012689 [Lamellibrachia satsuma]|nr:hypothetical protein LSAT2_012689 [Lamellibrachia satsuma]